MLASADDLILSEHDCNNTVTIQLLHDKTKGMDYGATESFNLKSKMLDTGLFRKHARSQKTKE